MGNYLLGLATPVAGYVLWLAMMTALARSSVTRRWCTCGDYEVRPADSWLPWWWWQLHMRAHDQFNRTHRAWSEDA